ncbi:hypothetical protein CHS0354_015192 [Potamilus streckersoni]|uniref:Uncharacterized protein n=1 Tax=Potamilus streckersoni TaxID=2493646 RepID=A0AAE0SD41_9BIVA|nr:hypothetical protein CHS0354_015192 [Potamilus streckersoni]
MMNPIHSFHFVDYIIFGITIVVSLGIGIYYALSGGKQRTTSEYLVGNRRMAVLPVAISLMATFESSIMMLGTPAEVYVYGFQWFIGNFGWFCANLLAIKLVVPLIHPLKITSSHEYLELRFKSRHIRTVGTVLGMLTYSLYMGIVLFGPAIALEALTGFPQWGSIVSVAVASVIYTAIGGIKAVIWTDVFQAAVMFAGFFAVLIKGTMVIGGVGRTWEIADQKGRLNMFNFDLDPTVRHTFWNLLLGNFIRGFGLIFNESSVQRISSIADQRDAKKVLLFTAPAFFVSLTLAGIEGIIAYAYYDTLGCDPIASKQIHNPNQIIPYMVMDIFQGMHGMPGLWLASLFSASLSTLSSGLSSLSALFWQDLVKPHVKPMSEKQATIIAKCSVVLFGGISVLVAFLIAMIGGTLTQITGSVLSTIGGPLTGLFLLGAFFPFANVKGGIIGVLAALVFTCWIAIGQMMTQGSVKDTRLPPAPVISCPNMNVSRSDFYTMNTTFEALYTAMWISTETTLPAKPVSELELTGMSRLYTVSYQWFGTIGILTTIVVGVIVSLMTGPTKPEESDPRYLISFYDEIFCCLPLSIRKIFRCGYNFKREKEPAFDKHTGKNKNIYDTDIFIEKENKMDIVVLFNITNTNENENLITKFAPQIDTLISDSKETQRDNFGDRSNEKDKALNKEKGIELDTEGSGQRIFLNSEHKFTFSKVGDERDDLPYQSLLANHDESNIPTGDRAEIARHDGPNIPTGDGTETAHHDGPKITTEDRAEKGDDVPIDETPMILRTKMEPARNSYRKRLYQMRRLST